MSQLPPDDSKPQPETYWALVKRDAKEGFRKNHLLILAFAGAILMFLGQWIVSSNEEKLREALAEVIAETSPKDGAATSQRSGAPVESRFISRSTARFWGELIVKLGEVLLISVGLEMLLHSDHYGTFFLGLVEKAVLGDRVVSALKSEHYLWERLSDIYFRLRFPKIQKRLSDTFSDYFPTEHTYYLDSYVSVYRISPESGSFIRMKQDISYTLIPTESNAPTAFKFGCTVYKRDHDDTQTSARVTGISVGSRQLTQSAAFVEKVIDGKPVWDLSVEVPVSGASEYSVLIRFEVVWDIDHDPYETFTVTSLVNDLRVEVDCADDIFVEWCDLGVKDRFHDIISHPTRDKIDKQYTGVVLRNQGYRFAIRKAVPNGTRNVEGHPRRLNAADQQSLDAQRADPGTAAPATRSPHESLPGSVA